MNKHMKWVELSSIAGSNAEHAALPVIVQPRPATPRYLPKRNENLQSHKYLGRDVYSSFTHNLPTLKTT